MLRCMAASSCMCLIASEPAVTSLTLGTAFNARRSPVALHLARTTLPKAPRPTSHKTAKSSSVGTGLARLDDGETLPKLLGGSMGVTWAMASASAIPAPRVGSSSPAQPVSLGWPTCTEAAQSTRTRPMRCGRSPVRSRDLHGAATGTRASVSFHTPRRDLTPERWATHPRRPTVESSAGRLRGSVSSLETPPGRLLGPADVWGFG